MPDDELMLAVMAPMDALLVEARFDVAELPISPFGVVQDLLVPAPAGVRGIRWEWDD